MATIKEINHDSSTTIGDHYDTVTDTGSRLTVTAGAALNSSTYGVNASNTDNTDSSLLEAFTAISGNEFRLRCYIDLSNVTVTGSLAFFSTFLRNTASTIKHGLQITAIASGNFNAVGRYRDDLVGPKTTNAKIFTQPISAAVCLELRAVRETADGNNDGIIEFLVDGVSIDSLTNVQNFNAWTSGGNMDEVYNVFYGSANFSGDFYFDEWILDDDEAADLGCAAAANAFRFLGFATDNTNLYVAGLKDATLKLYDYDLAALAENGTATFGSGSDAEIDAQTRGIFPVARPASDQVLYLYGRDGNNVQVQYNDFNGTLGWTDVGAGTATWGTAKYAVGLLPAQTAPNDVIVVFGDDDVYRTLFGTSSWAKMGDAPSGARVAGRDPLTKTRLIAGGTVAGTVHYSPNLGVSWQDGSGTAMGTINNFEWNL